MENIIGKRIAFLRKKLNLTQNEFGDKLKVTGAAVSAMELGKSNVTGQTISAICNKFQVSEDWLLYGKGDMYTLDGNLSSGEELLLEIYRQLTPEMKDVIFEHVKNLAEAEKQKKEKENARNQSEG